MNDTVVITGASRGIGKAAAQAFARQGYRTALICRNSAGEMQRLAHQLREQGTDAECYLCDVSSFAQVKAVSEQILQRFGRVDVLVNNAGISQIRLFSDITEEDWDRMFDVNVKGIFNFCRHLLPQMISRKSGKIINISSMWGIQGASCEVHYSASKAAVIGFTKALAQEVGPSGITVNCVAPGVIDTDMNAGLDAEDLKRLADEIPLERIGTPRNVADMIMFLASEKAEYITGQVFSVNGGMVL